MNEILNQIYAVQNLYELQGLLLSQENTDELREILFQEFLRYADYTCVSEWNRAVRLSECLAIIGWGNHEALEAHRGRFINGDPETVISNGKGDARFVKAFWSEGKYGLIMRTDVCWFYASPDDPLGRESTEHYPINPIKENLKLETQRNWICKNPIYIHTGWISHFPKSTPVLQSIDMELQPMLDENMRPWLYGNIFNLIHILLFFSSRVSLYKIVDDDVKLNRKGWNKIREFNWKKMKFEEKTLSHRYEIGPYRTATGKVNASICFEREFSEMPSKKQKEVLANHFIYVLEKIKERRQKKSNYNFDLMLADFKGILEQWVSLPIIRPPYAKIYTLDL